jgi:predicted ester cyclase
MPVRQGPAGHLAWLNAIRAAMPDLRYTIEDIVAGPEKAAARVTLAGTNSGPLAGQPPTGKYATAKQIFIFHLAGGQIVQEWVSFDRGSFMQQLQVDG